MLYFKKPNYFLSIQSDQTNAFLVEREHACYLVNEIEEARINKTIFSKLVNR